MGDAWLVRLWGDTKQVFEENCVLSYCGSNDFACTHGHHINLSIHTDDIMLGPAAVAGEFRIEQLKVTLHLKPSAHGCQAMCPPEWASRSLVAAA